VHSRPLLHFPPLFRNLLTLPALDMKKCVSLLQYWQHTERRQHLRKSCFIAADFAIQNRAFRDFIRNISPGGVFIEIMRPCFNGAVTTVAFSLPNSGEPFKVAGTVVWNSLRGVGVRFDTASSYLEAMIRLL
jgi:Tfp pilus assembly protein PilZ